MSNIDTKLEENRCIMKRFVLIAGAAILALSLLLTAVPDNSQNTQPLRIHIRANSNEDADQSVKYLVKNAIVEYLTPLLSECTTKEQAIDMVENHSGELTTLADSVLWANGFSYTSTVQIRREEFPARTYQTLTLPQGVYDAVIFSLGSGKGDNWWCVVYPPLCFVNGTPTGTEDIIYKSKLLEIIERFFREWEEN